MLQRAVELKKEQPFRSDETINQFLKQQFSKSIPKATLYRHLKQAGATRLKLGVTDQDSLPLDPRTDQRFVAG